MNENFGRTYFGGNAPPSFYQSPYQCPGYEKFNFMWNGGRINANNVNRKNSCTNTQMNSSIPIVAATSAGTNNKMPEHHVQKRKNPDPNGKFINGIKSIVSGLFHPTLNCDFHSNYYRHYNPKYKNNYMRNKDLETHKTASNKHLKTIKLGLNSNNNNISSTSQIPNNRNCNLTQEAKTKESQIMAIFSSEDFPELPTPKKPYLKPKCSNYEPAGKKSLQTHINIKKRNSDCTVEDDSFVIINNPSTSKNSEASPEKIPLCNSRMRSLSECSDDSFVICFTEDAAEGVIEMCDTDDEELKSSDDEIECNVTRTSKKTDKRTVISQDTEHLDSGFDDQGERKVRFNLKPEVHVMHVWDFAYRSARKGNWEDCARDRSRFRNKINNMASILNPILTNSHRDKIYKQRFCDNNNDK